MRYERKREGEQGRRRGGRKLSFGYSMINLSRQITVYFGATKTSYHFFKSNFDVLYLFFFFFVSDGFSWFFCFYWFCFLTFFFTLYSLILFWLDFFFHNFKFECVHMRTVDVLYFVIATVVVVVVVIWGSEEAKKRGWIGREEESWGGIKKKIRVVMRSEF